MGVSIKICGVFPPALYPHHKFANGFVLSPMGVVTNGCQWGRGVASQWHVHMLCKCAYKRKHTSVKNNGFSNVAFVNYSCVVQSKTELPQLLSNAEKGIINNKCGQYKILEIKICIYRCV